MNATKPTWDDAPCWANWMALDKNGSWYFFEFKPTPLPDLSKEDIEKYTSTLVERNRVSNKAVVYDDI